MKYCTHCKSDIVWQIPEGDNRHRHVCSSCHRIFYDNPRIVAGTIPIHDGKILLCKRAIQPRYGFWTLPAGFMENGETAEQAALRETQEEANADVIIQSLFSMVTVPHIDQVHIFFLAELREPVFSSGTESLEVDLFDPSDIPWSNIAFPTVSESLKKYLSSQTEGQLSLKSNPAEVFNISPQQALKKHDV